MFVQIHMLQSIPPGNVNRDDTGQPKKCLFGGVTRGRISSQCLKRNIRHSTQFEDAFGKSLGSRTKYLPRMVADALQAADAGIPQDESEEIMQALAGRFKRAERGSGEDPDDDDGQDGSQSSSSASGTSGQTGQLVFFPPRSLPGLPNWSKNSRNQAQRHITNSSNQVPGSRSLTSLR